MAFWKQKRKLWCVSGRDRITHKQTCAACSYSHLLGHPREPSFFQNGVQDQARRLMNKTDCARSLPLKEP